jgi:hypothetical protein
LKDYLPLFIFIIWNFFRFGIVDNWIFSSYKQND